VSEPLENGRITFTVKELLAKVDAKLDLIMAQLDAKANSHDLESLEARVIVLEGSAATEAQLKDARDKQARERKNDRRWIMVFGTGTLLSAAGLIANFIANL
jgi:hypothetical protein